MVILALTFSTLVVGVYYGRPALRLAAWTALKDFRELCLNAVDQVEPSACQATLATLLPPPPLTPRSLGMIIEVKTSTAQTRDSGSTSTSTNGLPDAMPAQWMVETFGERLTLFIHTLLAILGIGTATAMISIIRTQVQTTRTAVFEVDGSPVVHRQQLKHAHRRRHAIMSWLTFLLAAFYDTRPYTLLSKH
ncbi:hypothetical protein LTR95_012318 [Oleoguttula sp. CCFEE 5521]